MASLEWQDVSLYVVHRDGNGHEEEIPLLDNVSGGVALGDTLAMLGPRGSGKHTLMQLL